MKNISTIIIITLLSISFPLGSNQAHAAPLCTQPAEFVRATPSIVNEATTISFDIDGDGDLDLVANGEDSEGNPFTKLYENDGLGTFTDISATKGSALVGQDNSALESLDIDGDGDLDLLASGRDSSNQSTIYLYENDGSGTFSDITASKGSTLIGQQQGDLESLDIDGDGDMDLVASGLNSSSQPSTYLYENNGSGTFTDITATKGSALVGQNNSALAAFDIDGDGDLDLVASGRNSSFQATIYLYENDGSGTFSDITASKGSTLIGQQQVGLESFDIDGDGDMDLVASGRDSSFQITIYLYENDGSGTFTDITATKGSALVRQYQVVLSSLDIDGDGDLDLVASGRNSSFQASIYLYENDGTGTFTDITATKGSALVGQEEGALAAFDIDGDGDTDLIAVGDNANRVSFNVYKNDGSGTFDIEVVYDISFNDNETILKGSALVGQYNSALAAFDIDGDGDLDLVASGYDINDDESIYLYENNGSGTFTDITATKGSALVEQEYGALAAFDIDNDGDLDLVASGEDINNDSSIYLYENNGSGTFTDISATKGSALVGQEFSALAAFDIDGDGDLDLLASGRDSSNQSTIYLYENDGSGTFTDISATKGSALVGQEYSALAAFDMDNDGDLDFVASGEDINNDSSIYLYENDGSGTFTDISATKGSGLIGIDDSALATFDVDNDGDLDLVASGYSNEPVTYLYENNGSGAFSNMIASKGLALVGQEEGALAAFDIDNDGDLDLVASGYNDNDPSIHLYENDGSGTFSDITATKGSALVGQEDSALTAFDIDNDGDMDLVASGYNGDDPTIYLYENTCNPELSSESEEPTRRRSSSRRVSQSRTAELFTQEKNSESVDTVEEQENEPADILPNDNETEDDIKSTLGSGQCPANRMVTQNLKQGSVDGQLHSYAGTTAQDVALVQDHINRILAEYYNQAAGPVDGIFGPLTKQGVQRLQETLRDEQGFDLGPAGTDGIVGPMTRAAINNSC